MEILNYKKNLDMMFLKPQKPKSDCLIMFIHGGGWERGDKELFEKSMLYFEKHGIASASINYTLMSKNTSIRDCMADCEDAVIYLKTNSAKLGFDENKIIAFGDSSGAHLASVLGTPDMLKNKNAQVKTVIDCNGVVDLTGRWMDAVKTEKCFVDTYKEAYAISPVYHVTEKNSPTLVVHGLKDTAVLPQDSLKYYYWLKNKNVLTDIILLQNAEHAFILYDYRTQETVVNEIMDKIYDFIMQII